MPSQYPYQFSDVEALDPTTELYTQRRRSDLPPSERKFRISTLVNYLKTQFFINPIPPGYYISDADAASGGIAVGGLYRLDTQNEFGLPKGVVKERII